MKKVYYAPFIIVTEVVLEQGFLMDSVHGTSHEGFTPVNDPNLHVDDGTDDDSPF
ncbi:single-stranded DNA-binding protein [Segatella salivae]|uniref:single-stranded DNA-binding protein n=1 Tax=Segatella salivae TaxID=228604 RepID=UPI0028DD26AC|nr:single-stranded DNA-binding protein [Segatella salivae]